MSSTGMWFWLWASGTFLLIANGVNSCTEVRVGYPVGGQINWPSAWQEYPSNAQECWHIFYDGDPRNGDRVTITFTMVTMEGSTGCSNDVLEIRNHNSSGKVLARLCGDQACGHVTSTSDRLYLEFRSDDTIERGGFIANLKVSDPGDWQYSDTIWKSVNCHHTWGHESSGFSLTGILGAIVLIVLILIIVVGIRFWFIRRRTQPRVGAALAMPKTTPHGPPPQPASGYQGFGPEPYTPQPYPPGTPQPYSPENPQPYPPGITQPYPPLAPQPYSGTYPVQQYAPMTPNPPAAATPGPAAPPDGYWNPPHQAAYNADLPPSYETATSIEKV